MDGRRIGLLGGSFNPAHEGHLHISHVALDTLGLDALWWLVSPQNPLKPVAGMAPFEARLTAARALADDPRILVSDMERQLHTRYTADTLAALIERYPHAAFVWIMGADNLAQIEKWRDWTAIFAALPIAVFDRPTYSDTALACPAAERFAASRIDASRARELAGLTPPAWVFVRGKLNSASATRIREAGVKDDGNHRTATIVEELSIPHPKETKAATRKPKAAPKKSTPPPSKKSTSAKTRPQAVTKKPQAVTRRTKAAPKKPGAAPKRSRAAPKRSRAAPAKTVDSSARLLALIEAILDDGKAVDVMVIDLAGKSDMADYMVVATGGSSRQINALSDKLIRGIKTAKWGTPGVEGLAQGDWVLLDAGDVIVHLFRPEIRAFYNLEKMWQVALPDDGQNAVLG